MDNSRPLFFRLRLMDPTAGSCQAALDRASPPCCHWSDHMVITTSEHAHRGTFNSRQPEVNVVQRVIRVGVTDCKTWLDALLFARYFALSILFCKVGVFLSCIGSEFHESARRAIAIMPPCHPANGIFESQTGLGLVCVSNNAEYAIVLVIFSCNTSHPCKPGGRPGGYESKTACQRLGALSTICWQSRVLALCSPKRTTICHRLLTVPPTGAYSVAQNLTLTHSFKFAIGRISHGAAQHASIGGGRQRQRQRLQTSVAEHRNTRRSAVPVDSSALS